MGVSTRTFSLSAAAVTTLSSLITLAAPAVARTTSYTSPTVTMSYTAHVQDVSANGTSVSAVVCPAGTLPVGGGTALANPGVEQVVQAGFYASAMTRKIDGYQATVQVRGLARGRKVQFAVQAACVPTTTSVTYTVHTVLLTNGTSWWGAPCATGTLPAGGGTAVASPQIERVVQAGFHASAVTRKMDGYVATVQVRGLAHGRKVLFAVQVACVPTTIVVYIIHTLVLLTNGTSWWGALCPAGTLPAGGGTTAANPLLENVAGAGFHLGIAGKLGGYLATVQARRLPPGAQVPFAVQAACLRAAVPPIYGPPTIAMRS